MTLRSTNPFPARVVVALGLACALLVGASSAARGVNGANGIQVTVTPSSVPNTGSATMVSVTGSGFSTTQNGGFGIYVSFGERPATGDTSWATDSTRYFNGGPGSGTIWVTPGTPNGPNQAKLNANGTFSIQVTVRSGFTAANGITYPRSGGGPLGVLTYAAHGTEVSGFSQFAFVPISFVAAATPAPTPRPATPRPATPRPATPPPAATPAPPNAPGASARASTAAGQTATPEASGEDASAAPSAGASSSARASEGGPTWRPSPTPTTSPMASPPPGAEGPGPEPGQIVLGAAVGIAALAGAGFLAARRRQTS